ncbi:uncharacterized protein [Diabrotica undecimpunctata]|uniref:uncharacterized protein isoform X2 n=1 Tax=Diabrotica undecimpunctata TaxID=50387 RepID=UPI003B640094
MPIKIKFSLRSTIMKKFLVIAVLFILFSTTESIRDKNGCIDNICYKDETYPHEEIERRWKSSSNKLTKTFGELQNASEKSDLESKTSCELCSTSIRSKMQILSIIEDNNKRLYITRTLKYNPEIRVEVCMNGATCNPKNVQDNYVTSCQQQMSTISLLAYNTTSKEFQSYAVNYPSSCDCILSISDNSTIWS